MRDVEIPIGAEEFYSPFEMVLVKAAEENGNWIVYLEASNESIDKDNEVVMQKALQEASEYYVKHGVLSWDHKHKQMHDPNYIIGEPLDVAFPSTGKTLVKGRLYKNNRRAQGVWENLRSESTRFGASVGGYVLQKGAEGKKVQKVFWDETAITHKPINEPTQGNVSIVPMKEFRKALMAGAGINPAEFSSGRSLIGESMQGVVNKKDLPEPPKKITAEELNSLFKSLFEEIKKGGNMSHNDLVAFVYDHGYESSVAADIINYATAQLPEVVKQLRR